MRRPTVTLLVLLAFPMAGCNCQHPVSTDGGFFDRPDLKASHVATCDDVTCGDGTDAPVGGPHCNPPLACRKYDTPQPRCNWVHNLEHGHLVLLYNCPDGCDDDVAALGKVFDSQLPHRVIVAPDPTIPRRLAVLVWGHGWLGDAYDADAMGAMISKQDVDAPEKTLPCSQ